MCNDAYNRIQKTINKSFKGNVREMYAGQERSVIITVRDREHFYNLVHWSNKHIGQGSAYWTTGRVLRYVDPSKICYNPPHTVQWQVFIPYVDISALSAF